MDSSPLFSPTSPFTHLPPPAVLARLPLPTPLPLLPARRALPHRHTAATAPRLFPYSSLPACAFAAAQPSSCDVIYRWHCTYDFKPAACYLVLLPTFALCAYRLRHRHFLLPPFCAAHCGLAGFAPYHAYSRHYVTFFQRLYRRIPHYCIWTLDETPGRGWRGHTCAVLPRTAVTRTLPLLRYAFIAVVVYAWLRFTSPRQPFPHPRPHTPRVVPLPYRARAATPSPLVLLRRSQCSITGGTCAVQPVQTIAYLPTVAIRMGGLAG